MNISFALLSDDLNSETLNGLERVTDHVGFAFFRDSKSDELLLGSELELSDLGLLVLLHEAVCVIRRLTLDFRHPLDISSGDLNELTQLLYLFGLNMRPTPPSLLLF